MVLVNATFAHFRTICAIVNVADQESSQRITLEHPLRGEWLQIVIEGVYSGAREPDLAISELRVISQPAR